MKHILLAFCLLFSLNGISQQVNKTIIVEHFTNTYCSVCANRNPGFYTNLNNQSNVLHIAYHPSSPYAQCPLSAHNKTENDARTNHYGIFGGTPRLVIQGDVISPSANYSSASIFTPYNSLTSSFSLTNTIEQNSTNDSIITNTTITKEDASSLTSINLYAIVAEETLNFNAQNGESVHHDVFRKSFVGENAINITLPAAVGETITYRYAVKYNFGWNGDDIKSIVVLQNDNKSIEQASESTLLSNFIEPENLSIGEESLDNLIVTPTLFSDHINIYLNDTTGFNVQLYSLEGRLLYSQENIEKTVELGKLNLKKGVYIITVEHNSKKYSKKIIKL